MAAFSDFWKKLSQPPLTPPRLVFTDPTDSRVLAATEFLKANNLAEPILAGPVSASNKNRFLTLLAEKQQRQNLTPEALEKQLQDPLYHGVCLLLDKQVDGLVGGSLRPTADIVRAALQCIGPKPGVRMVSGQFLIESENRPTSDQTPFLFADCAVVPEPSPRILATTALAAADSYRFFTGKTPRVAFLAFSTRDSAQHPLVNRIKEALEITRKLDANLDLDGEIQVDAAMDAKVALIKKATDSTVAGKANVFVFPTLEAGNIGYKLVQRFSTARIAGPLLWGLDKPVSDLSRGCTVQEIIDSALCVGAMVRSLS